MSHLNKPFSDVQLTLNGLVATVQYKVNPLFTGKAPFTFQLLAYEDETFTEPLYIIPGTSFYIIDDTNTRQNQLPGFLYKVKLTTADNKEYLSSFIGWHPSDSITQHHYLLAYDISRRERVRFNYTGLFAYLIKRKSYNTGHELDPITGDPIYNDYAEPNEGYYDPMLTRLSIEKRETKEVLDEQGRGTQFSEMMIVRSVGFPFIDQHDLVATKDGKRFTVVDPTNKYFPGTTLILLQMPTLRLIPNTDPIYNINLPDFPDE